MQYKAHKAKDSTVFDTVVSMYKSAQTDLDPNQLQVGQTIVDSTTGEEMVVVEAPEGGTEKVLMPASQQGQPVPEVKTVEDSELTNMYSVQTPGGTGAQPAQTAKKKAQEDVDWDEVQSIATEIRAFANRQNMKGLMSAVEEITLLLLDNISMPEDTVMPEFTASKKVIASRSNVLPEFRRAGIMPETSVYPDVRSFHAPKKIDTEDEEEGTPELGKPGFSGIFKELKSMVEDGYQVVDIMLSLGEKYPREDADKVLAAAREKGII